MPVTTDEIESYNCGCPDVIDGKSVLNRSYPVLFVAGIQRTPYGMGHS